jgi:heme/copper-type cytochrome/quinol oxidase subunit 2
MVSAGHLRAQDQAPSRRDLTITIKDFRFTPDRVEVVQDDLVRLTLRSADIAHSFNIDEYRIARRIPAGAMTVVEFRADRTGTFPFYCNMTGEAGHAQVRGQFIVRAK